MGPDAMILVFSMLSVKTALSLSSFTFIKKLFISSLLSAIRVLSSAYLRLVVQAGFRKGREQIANIHWIIEKAREFQKNVYFCFIDYAKAFDYVDHNKLWKILKEMRIPDHISCLLRNLYAGSEATVRTGHGTMDWFQIGKGVRQGCILSPCLFNIYAEYVMWNARLDEAQAWIKMQGEISITSDIQMTPPLWWKAKKN